MESAIYEGWVRHRRRHPVVHDFRYRVYLMWLDLAELDRVFRGRWLWSTRRMALARFRREDHFGDPSLPLDQVVRDRVECETGLRPSGPIRLLTHLRYFGYVMNPVSFFYCFDPAGRGIEAVVAEVGNTPWGERHLYVLPAARSRSAGTRVRRWVFPKAFHVSPFLGMDLVYDWRFTQPGNGLVIHMDSLEGDRKLLDATLVLERREVTGRALAAILVRHPFMTAKVVTAIYLQAARLWRKRVPFFTHPGKIPSRVTA